MGKKMSNAPVFYTVVQVQFNTVLSVETYLPAIQDKMRVARFPDYKRDALQRIVFPFTVGDGEQVSTPSLIPQLRYSFGDIEGTSSFILESNSLALQTTTYDTFENFSRTFIDGLAIVHEALNLDLCERVGLRYLDAVIPQSETALPEYLSPEVHGLSHKIEGELSHSVSETVMTNKAGQLVSRTIIQNGRVGLPPEIVASSLKLNPRVAIAEGPHAILDTDAYYAQREAFNLSQIESRLSMLHDEVRKAFYAVVTPFALTKWA